MEPQLLTRDGVLLAQHTIADPTGFSTKLSSGLLAELSIVSTFNSEASLIFNKTHSVEFSL